MSRASKEQAAENRAKVVAAASSLFRAKGPDSVGIDELMAEAGLTRGGFYGQFGSKDELAGEACAHAFGVAERVWRSVGQGEPAGRARRLLDFYLKPKPLGMQCPLATLAGDAARSPPGGPLRRAFSSGLRRLAGLIAGETHGDDRALAVLAAMVGAVVLRQASDDRALAEAIESAVVRFVGNADAIADRAGAADAPS